MTSTSVTAGYLDSCSLCSVTLGFLVCFFSQLKSMDVSVFGCAPVRLLVGSTGVVVAGKTVLCFAIQYQSVVFDLII